MARSARTLEIDGEGAFWAPWSTWSGATTAWARW
jgi:hypothetical protein